MSPGRRQAIIWHSAGILLIAPPGTNFSELFSLNSNIFIEGNVDLLASVVCEMVAILSRAQGIK